MRQWRRTQFWLNRELWVEFRKRRIYSLWKKAQVDFPMRMSARHIGPFVDFRREPPTTITLLYFLVEVVIIRAMCLPNPVTNSGVNGPSSSSSIDWPSIYRASYLLYGGTWEGEVDKGRGLPATLSVDLHPFILIP